MTDSARRALVAALGIVCSVSLLTTSPAVASSPSPDDQEVAASDQTDLAAGNFKAGYTAALSGDEQFKRVISSFTVPETTCDEDHQGVALGVGREAKFKHPRYLASVWLTCDKAGHVIT